MPDPGSPDQGPKPRGQEPKKGAFGWYKPSTGEPRKLDLGDDQPHQDQVPATDQETLFRAAAIKCAQMEEELASLMQDSPMVQRFGDTGRISSFNESMRNVRGGNVEIQFSDGEAENAHLINISTDRRLLVGGICTDKKVSERFEEFAKTNPNATLARTEYFFKKDGTYGKILFLPKEFAAPELKQLNKVPAKMLNSYMSEVVPDDFEIAGQGLQMLINRLKPQEKSTE